MTFNPTVDQIYSLWHAPKKNIAANWPLIFNALQKWGVHYDSGIIAAISTIRVETASFLPIKEMGGDAYLLYNYDVSSKNVANQIRARRMGNTKIGDGILFCGKGFVQLTWKANYMAATRALQPYFPGIDLVKNPNDAMIPEVAAHTMAHYIRTRGVDVWAEKAIKAGPPPCRRCYPDSKREIIKDLCCECGWKKVRRLVNGGLRHYKEFRECAIKLEALLRKSA